jgi:hypothetical protein
MQRTCADIGWDEIRKPLGMVVMHVRQQNSCHNGLIAMFFGTPHQVVSQINNTCARIYNDGLFSYLKLDTGGIATIVYGMWSWSGITSPCAPETYNEFVGIHLADPLNVMAGLGLFKTLY